jgi:hypothetical protein
MIPTRETPKAIEERGTRSTKNARFSSGAMGRRKVIGGVFLLVLSVLITIVQVKLIPGGCPGVWSRLCGFWSITGPWGGFWIITIFICVLLIEAIVRAFRKR